MRFVLRTAVFCLTLALAATLLFSAGSTGKLKVATPGMVMKLEIRGRKVSVPPNKEVPLPAGTYKTAGLEIYAKAPRSRDLWRCNGRSYGKLAKVEIEPGQLTTLEGGQPIAVRTPVSIRKSKTRGSIVNIGLHYVGTSGESYSTVVYKGRSRVPRPKLMIVTENGHVIHKGQFEYG